MFFHEHLESIYGGAHTCSLVVARLVMSYLKGTLDCGLGYITDNEFILCGYTNSDWAGSV